MLSLMLAATVQKTHQAWLVGKNMALHFVIKWKPLSEEIQRSMATWGGSWRPGNDFSGRQAAV
jgi:hypothetical protein